VKALALAAAVAALAVGGGLAAHADATPAQTRTIAKQARTIHALQVKLAATTRQRNTARSALTASVAGQVATFTPDQAWSILDLITQRIGEADPYSRSVYTSGPYTSYTFSRYLVAW
jgi:hypothetical protein